MCEKRAGYKKRKELKKERKKIESKKRRMEGMENAGKCGKPGELRGLYSAKQRK